MPVLPEITISSKEKILLWEISESAELLMQLADLKEGHSVGLNRRQLQQLASACIVAQQFPGIAVLKDAWGKPWLPAGYPAISMSHSQNLAAVLFADAPSCGVDLEAVGDKILRIEQKFCNPQERENLDRTMLRENLHLIWGAKEALYKMYGKKSVDFKVDLHIEPFDIHEKGRLSASSTLPGMPASIALGYRFYRGYCLVWTEA